VRCDVVGHDQGGFVREAQERFEAEIHPLVPGGTTVAWLGMFENLERAILIGADQRLRPILMTTIVAFFGLLPASLATGLGSDVQRPLATVIVWGRLSATLLTLFVVPVLYEIVRPAVPLRTCSRG
jgi:Cu/Ag efflux pump CusA